MKVFWQLLVCRYMWINLSIVEWKCNFCFWSLLFKINFFKNWNERVSPFLSWINFYSIRAQATKRKLEQQREEKRRQQILSRRREEQREATEKYQRSHVPSRPPSGRPHSSRKSRSIMSRPIRTHASFYLH